MAANLAPSRCTDTDKSWWPMHRKPKADDENQDEFAVLPAPITHDPRHVPLAVHDRLALDDEPMVPARGGKFLPRRNPR